MFVSSVEIEGLIDSFVVWLMFCGRVKIFDAPSTMTLVGKIRADKQITSANKNRIFKYFVEYYRIY